MCLPHTRPAYLWYSGLQLVFCSLLPAPSLLSFLCPPLFPFPSVSSLSPLSSPFLLYTFPSFCFYFLTTLLNFCILNAIICVNPESKSYFTSLWHCTCLVWILMSFFGFSMSATYLFTETRKHRYCLLVSKTAHWFYCGLVFARWAPPLLCTN